MDESTPPSKKFRPVAVVTAAGGMMGTAICTRLARSGYDLVVNDRRDCLEPLAERLRAEDSTVVKHLADVATPEGAKATVEAALHDFGRIDVLVNVAGGIKGPVHNPLWEITVDQWRRTVSVNLDSAFFCIQRSARVMMKQRSGRIVNIASTSWAGSPLHAHYAAAKAGLISLTRSAAQQLGPYNVTVNAIAPGGTITYAANLEGFPGPDEWKDRNPLGRPNIPEDIADAVAFLIGDGARNISGQLLTVAGGLNPSL